MTAPTREEIDAESLRMLVKVGLTEDAARRFIEADARYAKSLHEQGKRPRNTLRDAVEALADCRAPVSLLNAYAAAGAPASRIIGDIARVVTFHAGKPSLPPGAVAAIEMRLATEPSAPRGPLVIQRWGC